MGPKTYVFARATIRLSDTAVSVIVTSTPKAGDKSSQFVSVRGGLRYHEHDNILQLSTSAVWSVTDIYFVTGLLVERETHGPVRDVGGELPQLSSSEGEDVGGRVGKAGRTPSPSESVD